MPENITFETLYNPDNAVIDVVFVHGLTGDPKLTWTSANGFWPDSRTAQQRRRAALNQISKHAVGILHADVSGAQEEFKNAESVDVSFEDDAVSVDGQMNFAESSNVFLKNAAILSLHLAACQDASFFHPRFALFDNIEDKGMQPKRSHKFQELIVRLSTEMPITNQVIFTTSLMNPNLEMEDYIIGPYYDEYNKTLEL